MKTVFVVMMVASIALNTLVAEDAPPAGKATKESCVSLVKRAVAFYTELSLDSHLLYL